VTYVLSGCKSVKVLVSSQHYKGVVCMSRFSKLVGIITLITFVTGCASITRGTRDALVLETEPSGAAAYLSNGYSCAETPCAIQVPRKTGFTVTFKKDGCKDKSVNVVTRMSSAGGAGMAGNVLVGGIVGVGVDAYTGAAKELIPNPVSAKLDC